VSVKVPRSEIVKFGRNFYFWNRELQNTFQFLVSTCDAITAAQHEEEKINKERHADVHNYEKRFVGTHKQDYFGYGKLNCNPMMFCCDSHLTLALRFVVDFQYCEGNHAKWSLCTTQQLFGIQFYRQVPRLVELGPSLFNCSHRVKEKLLSRENTLLESSLRATEIRQTALA
jgi:hypothetical protein